MGEPRKSQQHSTFESSHNDPGSTRDLPVEANLQRIILHVFGSVYFPDKDKEAFDISDGAESEEPMMMILFFLIQNKSH